MIEFNQAQKGKSINGGTRLQESNSYMANLNQIRRTVLERRNIAVAVAVSFISNTILCLIFGMQPRPAWTFDFILVFCGNVFLPNWTTGCILALVIIRLNYVKQICLKFFCFSALFGVLSCLLSVPLGQAIMFAIDLAQGLNPKAEYVIGLIMIELLMLYPIVLYGSFLGILEYVLLWLINRQGLHFWENLRDLFGQ